MGWEENHLSMFKKWRKEYHVYMEGSDIYDYPIEDASEYALCDLCTTPGLGVNGMKSSSLSLILLLR